MKSKTKELCVLALPALGLAILAVAQANDKPTLALLKSKVTSIPKAQRNLSNPYYPDTRLTVDVQCQQLPLLNRVWSQRTIRPKPNSTYLVDEQGKRYTFLKDYGGSSHVGNVRHLYMPNDGSGCSYTYELHLAQIPVSAGKIVFNTIYQADNGFHLPVSVTVRK